MLDKCIKCTHVDCAECYKFTKEKEWHFVDKELPTEWGFYLVAIEYGLNGERCVDVGEYSASENRWTVHGEREHHVVAWMWMPSPPKED